MEPKKWKYLVLFEGDGVKGTDDEDDIQGLFDDASAVIVKLTPEGAVGINEDGDEYEIEAL